MSWKSGPSVLKGLSDPPAPPGSRLTDEPTLDPDGPTHPEAYGVRPSPGYYWSREPYIDAERGLMGARWVELPDIETLERAREIQAEAERELGIVVEDPGHE